MDIIELTFITPIFYAIAYSIYTYMQKTLKTPPEKFSLPKFERTVVVGVIVGVFAVYSGITLTLTNFSSIAISISAVTLTDRLFIIADRLIQKYHGSVK